MNRMILALLSVTLFASAARAISIGEDDAWSFSDAVVVGSVQSVSSVRLLQEWGGSRIMLYRATIRATHIDGVRVSPHRVSFYYASPEPDPNSFIDRCPPFVELAPGQRFKLGGVLKEVQGIGRALWIPSGDYTKSQSK